MQLSPFLLGRTAEGVWRLAVGAAEVSGLEEHLAKRGECLPACTRSRSRGRPPHLTAWLPPGLRLQELRELMPTLPVEDLAVAGHAVALSQWHQVRRQGPWLRAASSCSLC